MKLLALVVTILLIPILLTNNERVIHRKINNVRDNHGLVTLRIDEPLQVKSHRRARYMRKHNIFRHPSGLTVSENIGWITCRDRWARALIRLWMNSLPHRIAILTPHFRFTGVGVSKGPFRSYPCVYMVVQRFK